MSLTIGVEPTPLSIGSDDVVRIGKTRVTLDTLVAAFKQGATPEEIIYQYPSLELADVYGAISYYLRHTDEVEAYLIKRLELAQEIRLENERRFDPADIRARLLKRKQT